MTIQEIVTLFDETNKKKQKYIKSIKKEYQNQLDYLNKEKTAIEEMYT